MSRPVFKVRCRVTHNSRGEPCKPHWAMHGQQVCSAHGGRAPQNKRAAQRRLTTANAWKEAEQLLGESGSGEHPIQHMLRRLYHSQRMIELLGAEVADLRGLTEDNRLSDIPELHPLLAEFGAWCDRNVKYAKVCQDAGVQEREVRLAEQQAQLVVEAFRRAVVDDSWGLTAEQRARGMQVFGRHLRLVESKESA